MSRQRFVQLLAGAAPGLILASVLAVGGPQASGAPKKAGPEVDEVVHPTGVFPGDVHNVQAAVDRGGTILLKATDAAGLHVNFNFGPATDDGGFVDLTNDVVLLGETVDGLMTTIEGGDAPFRGFDDAASSTFRGIRFNGPRLAAVFLFVSTGLEFSDCWVHDTVIMFSESYGILAGGDITGTFLATNNLFENINGEFGVAVKVVGIDADAIIAGNTILGASTGISVALNSRPMRIEDNFVMPGPLFNGNGIAAHAPAAQTGTFSIANNTVICESPFADGIYLLGTTGEFGENPVLNSVVEKNAIEMRDSMFGGITFYGAVSDCTVRNNKIRGTGAYALQIEGPFLGGPAANNTFHGNNLSHFSAVIPSFGRGDMADVFLDVHTQDTVVHGRIRSVIDLGVDNQVSGSK